MITRDQLLEAGRYETKIIEHLATRLPEGALEWRPTPAQRSTVELMRYLAWAPAGFARNAVTETWEHAPEMMEEAASVDLSTFAEAMDRQLERVEATLRETGEESATVRSVDWITGEAISPVRVLVARPLRDVRRVPDAFFLYAKAAGNADLGTYDCWVGDATLEA